jgi:hypothetical protein
MSPRPASMQDSVDQTLLFHLDDSHVEWETFFVQGVIRRTRPALGTLAASVAARSPAIPEPTITMSNVVVSTIKVARGSSDRRCIRDAP